MQTRLWKLASAMTFVVLQFGKRLNEGELEVGAWQALRRVVDAPPSRRKAHWSGPLSRSVGPLDRIAVQRTRDGTEAVLQFTLGNHTKQRYHRLAENGVVIDSHNDADVTACAQRVERRGEATF